MDKLLRETGRGLCAFLFALALTAQSALPVCADTEGAEYVTAAPDRTVLRSATAAVEEIWVSGSWENGTAYELDYFDRIAINSVRGFLTIRTGEDFSIWLPDGWEEAPGYSVQDDILVVSGKKSAGTGADKNSGSAVVLGEDEPADGAGRSAGTGRTGSHQETSGGRNSAAVNEAMHEIVITVPSGTGLETLRIAMESGDLFLSNITADSVTIQSGGGSLILRDASLGTVDIYTGAGEVSMAGGAFRSLNIGMGEGEVSVSSGEELSECRMELKTGDGEIILNGKPEGGQLTHPGNGKRSLTVQVSSGDIHVDG